MVILEVKKNKASGQKFINIPKDSYLDEGDYVELGRIKTQSYQDKITLLFDNIETKSVWGDTCIEILQFARGYETAVHAIEAAAVSRLGRKEYHVAQEEETELYEILQQAHNLGIIDFKEHGDIVFRSERLLGRKDGNN